MESYTLVQSRMSKQIFDKSPYFVKAEWTGGKVDRTGDNVASSVDFVAGSFDFLHLHEHVLI